MARYALFSGNRITAILNSKPLGRDYIIVPEELSSVTDSELITHHFVQKDSIKNLKNIKKPEKVAVISNWNVNCGIATYTKYLVNSLKKTASVKIFAEVSENVPFENDIVRCWDRKGDYTKILTEIEKYNPDLIIIQHEFGLFHKINLWQSLLSQLSRWRVITTFHTVLEHRVSNPSASLDYKARCFAEMACPEIVVHQKKARETLRDRGYSGRVHYIPHGCFEPNREKRLQPQKYGMYTDHSMFQYGFGGRHKGWEFAINTVEILRSKYPEILYLGVFNIPVGGESQTHLYHLELLDLIKKKNLIENVSIIRGFQSESMIRNILSGVKVGFFPYQSPKNWFSWGASGAVQMPLSMGLPLVLGEFSQFEEYRGLIPIVKTPEDAATEIDKLFSDQNYWNQMSEKSFKISSERTWDQVAEWYLTCNSNQDFDAL